MSSVKYGKEFTPKGGFSSCSSCLSLAGCMVMCLPCIKYLAGMQIFCIGSPMRGKWDMSCMSFYTYPVDWAKICMTVYRVGLVVCHLGLVDFDYSAGFMSELARHLGKMIKRLNQRTS